MRRSTIVMLLPAIVMAAILAAIIWGTVIWQERQRPRVVIVPTRVATTPLTDTESARDFTITLIGRIIDANTRAEVPVAAVRIRAPTLPPSTGGPRGVLDVGPSFQAQIPANRVSTLTIVAPGYTALEQEMKPHYQRNVTLTMDIPLEPVDLEAYRPILDDLIATFSGGTYGLYSRLTAESTRIVVEKGLAVMRYPRLEGNVETWPEWEGFEVAYGVRAYLLGKSWTERSERHPDQVKEVWLNAVDVPATVGDEISLTQHLVVAWVLFRDNGVVALDLTPLGADVNPLHSPATIYGSADSQTIDQQFEAHRQGVPLDKGQPMKVGTYQGKTYYLQAAVNVLADEYQFLLEGFEIQPATPTAPLQFVRGAVVGLRIKAADFDPVQALMQADPPFILQQKQHLLHRQGDEDPDLAQVLYDNLDIPYYLATKLEVDGQETATSMRYRVSQMTR